MINFKFKLNLYRHDIIYHSDKIYKKLLINKRKQDMLTTDY